MTSKLTNAYDLLLMSLYKPDHELRTQAKELGCYDEMITLRNQIIRQLTNDYNVANKHQNNEQESQCH